MANKTVNLLLSFLKIGAIGFGGGSALIPVLEQETVKKNKFLTDDDFTKNTVIASVTPGALPLKLALLTSDKLSILCGYAICFPGVFALLLIMTGFSIIGESAIKYIEFASIGISTFIILLLTLYVHKVMGVAKSHQNVSFYASIVMISFTLTCGSEIFKFIHLLFGISLGTPIFDISALNLVLIALYVIGIVGGSKSYFRFVVAFVLSTLYALSVGKAGLFPFLEFTSFFMVVSLFVFMFWDYKKSQTPKVLTRINMKWVVNIFLFVGIAAAFSFLALLFEFGNANEQSVFGFLTNALLSSFTSFGGGEAYVSVGDGYFVHTGYVSPAIYYNQLVAAANALPGPISIKLVAGIGFVFGTNIGGIGFGWLLALAGCSIAIACSAIVAIVMYLFFDSLSHSPRVLLMKKYMLPVICGMLISTMFSILVEALGIIKNTLSVAPAFGLVAIALLFALMLFLHKKYQVNDIILLTIGGGSTLATCLTLTIFN